MPDPSAQVPQGIPQTSFIDTLGELNRGDLVPELDDAITRLVAAVHTLGKKGTLTLKLTAEPASKVGGDTVFVSASLTESLPKPARSATLFYADERGALAREDPRQMKLELQQAEQKAPPQLRRLAANDRD